MTVSRSWGLASLMRCAERAVCKTKGQKQKQANMNVRLLTWGEASTAPQGCPTAGLKILIGEGPTGLSGIDSVKRK